MKSADSRRLQTWLRLLACLLVALGTIEGAVLCFDAEGHVALERAAEDCCDDGGSEGIAQNQRCVRSASAEDCGPCVDVVLSSAGAVTRSQISTPNLQPSSTLAALLSPQASDAPVPFCSLSPLCRESSADSALSSLRSVILLV